VAEELKRLVAQTPDATAAELLEALTARTSVVTNRAALQRALPRLGFSHKKSPSPPPSATRRRTSGAGASSRRS
jgi:transposase